MRFTWLLCVGLLACSGDTVQTVSSGNNGEIPEDPDETPPLIEHNAITDSQLYGEPVAIVATVTDEEGSVVAVEVFFKTETSQTWDSAPLSVGATAGHYEGRIPGGKVTGGGMDYFIFAVDSSGNESTYPEEGEDDPFHFRVSG